MATNDDGLGVGGFIAIVIVILILNVAGVIGYNMYTKKNPDKAIAVNLDSDTVPKLRYGMLGLLFLSWIFSIACTTACTFVKLSYTLKSFYPYMQETEMYYYLGLRGAQRDGVCTFGDIEDNRVRTAYAFGVINNLLTTAALGGCLSVVFKVIKDDTMANKIWKAMGFLILASTWCCLFTFYVQETDECTNDDYGDFFECSLGGAGVAQVFNSMFLIGICVLFFVLPSPALASPDAEAESAGNDAADKDPSHTEEDNGGDEPTNSKEDMHEDIELDDAKQSSF